MSNRTPTIPKGISLPRRRFVQGLAAGGVLLGGAGFLKSSMALAGQDAATPVLRGKVFDLVIGQSPVNFTGRARMATTINGSLPAPTLIWQQGETVTLRATNRLAVDTSIHWHGMILPFDMDGVPGISYRGIAPGETFTYQFTVQQSGTYWYHSHSGFQELTGMYGAIIVVPAGGERIKADRDYVVQLSDWTDDDPMSVFAKLKVQSDVYNTNQPTAQGFLNDVSREGLGRAVARRKMWNAMRMNPTDLADVSSPTFTYLMNGATPNGNWTGLFKRGERVRLRFINAASNTFYDVRIPGLKLTVVQADGQDVEPVTVDEFRFGPGETYDVLVEPVDDAYTVFAQSMDRSGYARGTLATQAGLTAAVPALDAVQWLSMTDMMGRMDQGSGHDGMDMSAMQHGTVQHNMGAMHHGGMMMDHSQHAMQRNPLAVPSQTVRHASTEYGPSVDMRVDRPRTNLDDPGVGLRNNGRRVLTLNDLHTFGGAMDKRTPGREVELHLTGNMERYSWSFDGLEFGGSTPVHFNHGERLRVILQNDTMMTHPMHLHGLWSELENDRGEFMARRHTLPVQPAQRISFQVTADALGRWAWHCHLAFHMDAGMFREVVVS
ncbi:MAG TPA: copper resistance system multicopper oxidase [Pseudomonadales bacterium]